MLARTFAASRHYMFRILTLTNVLWACVSASSSPNVRRPILSSLSIRSTDLRISGPSMFRRDQLRASIYLPFTVGGVLRVPAKSSLPLHSDWQQGHPRALPAPLRIESVASNVHV